MEQRVSLITLGVKDLVRSRKFYEGLGWEASPKSQDAAVFFQLGGLALSLFSRLALAEDARVDPAGDGFRGITLAYNVPDKASVAKTLAEAKAAGAKIIKEAEDVFWGGHSGYFADPDGHLWEVAWNPFSTLTDDGQFKL